MRTLIIHPSDRSTDFLRPIYQPLDQYTIITRGTRQEVNELIKSHDRIMMMGHGAPWGLFSVDQFDGSYIIDHDSVPLLGDKECVFIWCNADKFVNRHNLKGLYSGMFVSELGEAMMMGLGVVARSVLDESNNMFAKLLGEGINRNLYHAYHRMMNSYEQLAQRNPVAKYNSERLYLVL
jgi:hypothetical protein